MTQFLERYGSDDQCEAALIASRWPEGFACPACDSRPSNSLRREGRLYFQCSACRHQCSVISGSIFKATKLPLTRWFLAMPLLTQSKNNVAALELMRHLGICYKTAWLVKHKLMQVMREREDSRVLDGRVEIDDAYLGGELAGGKSGRWLATIRLAGVLGCDARRGAAVSRATQAIPNDLVRARQTSQMFKLFRNEPLRRSQHRIALIAI